MEKVILCFGDSNTYGLNPSTGGRYTAAERWPCVLQAQLGPGWRVLEEGLPGRTTVFEDPAEEGIAGLPYLRPCLLSHAPIGHLVVMLGTNDAKEHFCANSGIIAKGMGRLLQKALDTGEAWRGKPHILLVAPTPVNPARMPWETAQLFGAGCAEKTAALAGLYACLARQMGLDFLDAAACGAPDELDGIHLNAETHRNIALAVKARLKTPDRASAGQASAARHMCPEIR